MRRTLELKRVDVSSLFKVAFVLYAVLGLVAGLCFALVFMMLGQLGSFLGDEHIPGFGMISGVAGVVAIPVMSMIYGMMGSIVVTIVALLYNLAAGRVGGVKFEFETGEMASAVVTAAPASQT
jgi:uncharacterized membrane protein YedE/YeeE